jgi:hypothetical protein
VGNVVRIDDPLLEEKRPVEDIVHDVEVDLPTPEEVKAARVAANLNGGQFGRELGQCRVGWLHGVALAKYAYRRSTVHMIESGKMPVSKAFALAFRRWQAKVPRGVTFLSGVRSAVEIPDGAIVVWGQLFQCAICGRMLIGHPMMRYCPESVSPSCRAEVKRRRAERRREQAKERRHQKWQAEMAQAQRELDEAREQFERKGKDCPVRDD